MSQSIDIRDDSPPLLETWRRFYNGPNAGMIDVSSAKREVPWLVGESPAVTLRFDASANDDSLESTAVVVPEE